MGKCLGGCWLLAAASPFLLTAQTSINGSRVIWGSWDATNAISTKPAKAGTSLPTGCAVGEVFFKTDATAGQNLYFCTSTDHWEQMKGGTGGGSSGLVKEFAAAICQSAAASLGFSTSSANPPVPDCTINSHGVIYGVAKFGGDQVYAVQGHFRMPDSFTSATLDIDWRVDLADNAKKAVWRLKVACAGDDDPDDADLNGATAQSIDSFAKTTAYDVIRAQMPVTATGCGGKIAWFQFDRDSASDTLGAAVAAELIGLRFTVQ